MTSMEELLVEFVKQTSNSCEVSSIAQAMKVQNFSLSDLIEMLEPSLTSREDRDRHRATLLIATLLEDSKLISETPTLLHLFVVFFCRRLQDFPSIGPCLQALTTVVKLYATLLEARHCDVLDIVQSVSKNVHIPSYAQTVRQRAFELFLALIENDQLRPQIDSIGALFLEGLANVIEGEKDPRCLLRGLRALHLAMQYLAPHLNDILPNAEVDDLTLAERIFDHICCYFPISFRSAVDDGVSEQLDKSLENCLCTSPPIAKLAVPFLLEQLMDSEAADARVSALKYLNRTVEELGFMVLDQVAQPKQSQSFHQEMDVDHDHNRDDHQHQHHHEQAVSSDKEAGTYMAQLARLMYELFQHEANGDILAQARTLCRTLTQKMCREATFPAAWQSFHEFIVQKFLRELQHNPDTQSTQNIWKLCLCLGASGCWQSGVWLGQRMVPALLPLMQTKSVSVFLRQMEKLSSAMATQVSVLPSLAAQDRISSTPLRLLQGLVQLQLQHQKRPAHASSAGAGVVDVSQCMVRVDTLVAHREALVDQLLSFLAHPLTAGADNDSDGMMTKHQQQADGGVQYRMEEDAVECVSVSISTLQHLFALTGVQDMESRFDFYLSFLFSVHFFPHLPDAFPSSRATIAALGAVDVLPLAQLRQLENADKCIAQWSQAATRALCDLCRLDRPAYCPFNLRSDKAIDEQRTSATASGWRALMLRKIVQPLVQIVVSRSASEGGTNDPSQRRRDAQRGIELLQHILRRCDDANDDSDAADSTDGDRESENVYVREVCSALFTLLEHESNETSSSSSSSSSSTGKEHSAVEALLSILVQPPPPSSSSSSSFSSTAGADDVHIQGKGTGGGNVLHHSHKVRFFCTPTTTSTTTSTAATVTLGISSSPNDRDDVCNCPIVQLLRAVRVSNSSLSSSGVSSLAQLLQQCVSYATRADARAAALLVEAGLLPQLLPRLEADRADTSTPSTTSTAADVLTHQEMQLLVATLVSCDKQARFFLRYDGNHHHHHPNNTNNTNNKDNDMKGSASPAYRLAERVVRQCPYRNPSDDKGGGDHWEAVLLAILLNKMASEQEVSSILSLLLGQLSTSTSTSPDGDAERATRVLVTVTNVLLWRAAIPMPTTSTDRTSTPSPATTTPTTTSTTTSWQEFLVVDVLLGKRCGLSLKTSSKTASNTSAASVGVVARAIPQLFRSPAQFVAQIAHLHVQPATSQRHQRQRQQQSSHHTSPKEQDHTAACFRTNNMFWRQKTWLWIYAQLRPHLSSSSVPASTSASTAAGEGTGTGMLPSSSESATSTWFAAFASASASSSALSTAPPPPSSSSSSSHASADPCSNSSGNSSGSSSSGSSSDDTNNISWIAVLVFFECLAARSSDRIIDWDDNNNDNNDDGDGDVADDFLLSEQVLRSDGAILRDALPTCLSLVHALSPPNTTSTSTNDSSRGSHGNSSSNTSEIAARSPLQQAVQQSVVGILRRFLHRRRRRAASTDNHAAAGFVVEDQLHLIFPLLFSALLHSPEARTRMSALQSLSSFLLLRPSTESKSSVATAANAVAFRHVYPYKRALLKTLLLASDDRKRIVRQAAARLRNAFLLYLAQENPT